MLGAEAGYIAMVAGSPLIIALSVLILKNLSAVAAFASRHSPRRANSDSFELAFIGFAIIGFIIGALWFILGIAGMT